MVSEETRNSLKYASTRYQGSKRKIAQWIVTKTKHLKYNSVLDGFCGTCSVAYEFKKMGKKVVCNDILKSNYITAVALIVNSQCRLDERETDFLLKRHSDLIYPCFIQNTFEGIYYRDEENRWIDKVNRNIQEIENPYKKAIASFALFQSCLVKRPFNLFHRKNLYLRLNHVERTFNNYKTWERDFDQYFRRFVDEANACVFSNGLNNKAWNMDVFDIKEADFDLVYFDPPYVSLTGRGTDYYHYYHFLEGLCDYDRWKERIDYKSRHLRLKSKPNLWTKRKTIVRAFERLFKKFQDNILVVSYGSPSFPSKSLLKTILEQYKTEVKIYSKRHKYALSKRNNNLEILLIGE